MIVKKAVFALSLLAVSGVYAGKVFRNTNITDAHSDFADDVEAQATTFAGSLLITGNLTANNSVFKSNMTVNGVITLADTHTRSITVITTPESKNPQVKLEGRTVVDGDIRFEGEEGTVVTSVEAIITGKVVHGSLIIEKQAMQQEA